MSKCNYIGVYNIDCLVQNQDFTTLMIWEIEGQPFDLSIYQNIFFDVFDGNKRILRKTVGNGLIISGNDNEVLTLSLDQNDTVLFTKPKYTHEFRFLTATSENNYLISGEINVTQTKSR